MLAALDTHKAIQELPAVGIVEAHAESIVRLVSDHAGGFVSEDFLTSELEKFSLRLEKTSDQKFALVHERIAESEKRTDAKFLLVYEKIAESEKRSDEKFADVYKMLGEIRADMTLRIGVMFAAGFSVFFRAFETDLIFLKPARGFCGVLARDFWYICIIVVCRFRRIVFFLNFFLGGIHNETWQSFRRRRWR